MGRQSASVSWGHGEWGTSRPIRPNESRLFIEPNYSSSEMQRNTVESFIQSQLTSILPNTVVEVKAENHVPLYHPPRSGGSGASKAASRSCEARNTYSHPDYVLWQLSPLLSEHDYSKFFIVLSYSMLCDER